MAALRIFSCMALGLACLGLIGCGDSSSGGSLSMESDPPPSHGEARIYVVTASGGRLESNQDESTQNRQWQLTLHDPSSVALWYEDWPGRETGTTPLTHYLDSAWALLYEDLPPHATLLFQPEASDTLDGVYLALSDPRHHASAGSITFTATVLNTTLELPALLAFTNATLNILNNVSDDQEVASYVQYSDQAQLAPGANAGEFELQLAGIGPDMFWVDNAPGRYSDARPVEFFLDQWSYIFKDSLPNAALVGTNSAGDLKAYFVTLDQPALNDSGQLRYSVKLLQEHHGALEPLNQTALLIDSGHFTRFPVPGKGTAYQAFGQGYDPSTANTSFIYFGSDIARKQTASLWGTQSYLSQPCAPHCRNDLQTLRDMGINLIRLYDWDPRNDHSQFLDYAHSLGLKVIVPISNWLPTQPPSVWNEAIPTYFTARNFGNSNGKDWHPAIAGVVISNELEHPKDSVLYQNVIGIVARFIQEADSKGFGKSVPIGVPVRFSLEGGELPAWHAFDRLVNDSRMEPYKDRLMLCPNTYNSATYLFENAEERGQGWVQLTYQRYQMPILFTEIGFSRAQSGYTPDFIRAQLTRAIEYQKQFPEQLLGVAHFQFDDKVWMQNKPADTEGAFGAFHHGEVVLNIPTVQADYDFWVSEANGNFGVLTIDKLVPTTTYDAVVGAYR